MHHKFTRHGKGLAQRAISYLLREKDHQGKRRAEIKVLRGDPELMAKVADSLTFSRRYTSGVIAWSPDDQPSDTEIQKVLDDYERLAFAGLDPERYSWTAVLHRDDNGTPHIHTLTARVDLETGKSLNIAPPGHRRDFDAFRDHWNYAMGWARPDDPDRVRALHLGSWGYKPGNKSEIKCLFKINRVISPIATEQPMYLITEVLKGEVRTQR